MRFSLCHSPVSEEEVNETRILVSNKLLHEKFLLGGKTPKPPNLSPQLSLKKKIPLKMFLMLRANERTGKTIRASYFWRLLSPVAGSPSHESFLPYRVV